MDKFLDSGFELDSEEGECVVGMGSEGDRERRRIWSELQAPKCAVWSELQAPECEGPWEVEQGYLR